MIFNTPELRSLLNLNGPDEIKSAELIREFSDDHIACATATINGTEVDLFWCGSAVIGALDMCDESAKARKKVFDALSTEISTSISCMFDEAEDELEFAIEHERVAFEAVLERVRKLGPDHSTWQEIVQYKPSPKLVDVTTMTLV